MSTISEPKSQAKRYTPADHQKACEEWLRTGNYMRAAEIIGNTASCHNTVRHWARADYHCQFGCPWHDWERIKKQRQEELRARLVIPDAAAEVSGELRVGGKELALRLQKQDLGPLKEVLHGDIESLIHWTLVYNKAYYYVMGIILPCPYLRDANGEPCTDEYLKAQYEAGLHPTSLEQAVRTFAAVQHQIHNLIEVIGLRKKGEVQPLVAPPPDRTKDLSIDELLQVRKAMEGLDPETHQVLAKLLNVTPTIIEMPSEAA